jgi:hypothetical protein
MKSNLLSMVQQITIAAHSCARSSFTSDTCPNLKTLLVVHKVRFGSDDQFCEGGMYCPILERARPEKLVIHARRRDGRREVVWPVVNHQLVLNCSTFTLVLDETDTLVWGSLPVHYEEIDWKIPKEIRLVITRERDHPDDVAQGSPSTTDMYERNTYELRSLLHKTILSLFGHTDVPITIYLFRPFGADGEHLAMLQGVIDGILSRRHQDQVDNKPKKPECTIKTLEDYIEEGCEDEFPPDELRYWREMYEERKNLEKAQTERE